MNVNRRAKALKRLINDTKIDNIERLRQHAIRAANLSEHVDYTPAMYLRLAADWIEMIVDDEAFENYRTNEECLEQAIKSIDCAIGLTS